MHFKAGPMETSFTDNTKIAHYIGTGEARVDSSGPSTCRGRALKLSGTHPPERFSWLAGHRRSHPCQAVHPPATKPPRSGGPQQWMRNSCPVKGRTTTDLESGSCLAMCGIILYPVVQTKTTIEDSQVSCPLI